MRLNGASAGASGAEPHCDAGKSEDRRREAGQTEEDAPDPTEILSEMKGALQGGNGRGERKVSRIDELDQLARPRIYQGDHLGRAVSGAGCAKETR